MYRSEEQIAQSLVDSINSTDPSVDVTKGPVYDMLLSPVPAELSLVEEKADRVSRLVTLQLDQVVTDDEASAIATTLGISLPRGDASHTSKFVFWSSNPVADSGAIQVPVGTMVGTTDGRYTFATTRAINVPLTDAAAYYVASRRRYEFQTNIEATGVGPDYDLPPTRISKMFSQIPGIDGCSNLESTSGGTNPADASSAITQARIALAGLDPEVGGGLVRNIFQYNPDKILSVSLVYPKDRPIFARRVKRPSIDAYVYADSPTSNEFTLTAAGGEQTIALPETPVLSVESVRVNSSTVAFSFLQDTTPEIGLSARANDRIRLATPLSQYDVLIVNYTTSDVHRSLQDRVFDTSDRPFGTDVLARMFREVQIEIVARVKLLPSVDEVRAGSDILDVLTAIVETNQPNRTIVPRNIAERMPELVAGVAANGFNFEVFGRTVGRVGTVESITLGKHELARIDGNLIHINLGH